MDDITPEQRAAVIAGYEAERQARIEEGRWRDIYTHNLRVDVANYCKTLSPCCYVCGGELTAGGVTNDSDYGDQYEQFYWHCSQCGREARVRLDGPLPDSAVVCKHTSGGRQGRDIFRKGFTCNDCGEYVWARPATLSSR